MQGSGAMKHVYAEDVNYWQTSTSEPDAWIARAKAEIKSAGGVVMGEAFGQDADGRSAYMLAFAFGTEQFRAVWPVLPSKTRNERAARIQAATMLYHDIKAKCVAAKVHGARAAFFPYLLLSDGRVASAATEPALMDAWPKLLTG